jgi:hypothetical protein
LCSCKALEVQDEHLKYSKLKGKSYKRFKVILKYQQISFDTIVSSDYEQAIKSYPLVPASIFKYSKNKIALKKHCKKGEYQNEVCITSTSNELSKHFIELTITAN